MNCKKHKIEMTISYPYQYEDDVAEEPYYYCILCLKNAEKKRMRELAKNANIVVRVEEVVIGLNNRHRSIIKYNRAPILYYFPHGGNRVRKGSYALVNSKNGFIEKTTKENGDYFVIG